MLNGIKEFSYLLSVDPFWVILLVVLLLVLAIVKCIYPWQPKWKSKAEKDKDGNTVTKYYHLED